MAWSLSFKLQPGEEIIDDSTKMKTSAIKPAYSVFLTNRRAVFRFDTLGSSLIQSFDYEDIDEAMPTKRLLIDYLSITSQGRKFFLNTSDARYWAERIMQIKDTPMEIQPKTADGGAKIAETPPKARSRTTEELKEMLTELKEHGMLSHAECEEKLRLLDRREPPCRG